MKTTIIILSIFLTFIIGLVAGNEIGFNKSEKVLNELIAEENTGWELDGLHPMTFKEVVKEDTDRDVWNSGYYQALKAFEYNLSK